MNLKNSRRYQIDNLVEVQFESGSNNSVYKNLLGIINKKKMDRIEYKELVRTSKEAFSKFEAEHKFNEKDIKNLHKSWLGKIYLWAGEYRKLI